jgi:hypothetical protein
MFILLKKLSYYPSSTKFQLKFVGHREIIVIRRSFKREEFIWMKCLGENLSLIEKIIFKDILLINY